MTTFTYKNINKPTPQKIRVLGNGLIMFSLAMQPLIVGAPVDVMGDVGKFWTSVALTSVGLTGKIIAMMFGESEELNIEQNGGIDGQGKE